MKPHGPDQDIDEPVPVEIFSIGDTVSVDHDYGRAFIISTIVEPNNEISYFTTIGSSYGRPGFPESWMRHARMVLLEIDQCAG